MCFATFFCVNRLVTSEYRKQNRQVEAEVVSEILWVDQRLGVSPQFGKVDVTAA